MSISYILCYVVIKTVLNLLVNTSTPIHVFMLFGYLFYTVPNLETCTILYIPIHNTILYCEGNIYIFVPINHQPILVQIRTR